MEEMHNEITRRERSWDRARPEPIAAAPRVFLKGQRPEDEARATEAREAAGHLRRVVGSGPRTDSRDDAPGDFPMPADHPTDAGVASDRASDTASGGESNGTTGDAPDDVRSRARPTAARAAEVPATAPTSRRRGTRAKRGGIGTHPQKAEAAGRGAPAQPVKSRTVSDTTAPTPASKPDLARWFRAIKQTPSTPGGA
jgi:hypothetical protein